MTQDAAASDQEQQIPSPCRNERGHLAQGERARAWAEKMAGLNAIHGEIASQLKARRIALDGADAEAIGSDPNEKWPWW